MTLLCSLDVMLGGITRKESETVLESLEPDNVDLPENLTLELSATADGLLIHLECRDSMRGMAGTMDEILEHAQVALQAGRLC